MEFWDFDILVGDFYLHNVLGEHIANLVQKCVQRRKCRVVQCAFAQLMDQLGIAGMDGGDQENACLDGPI